LEKSELKEVVDFVISPLLINGAKLEKKKQFETVKIVEIFDWQNSPLRNYCFILNISNLNIEFTRINIRGFGSFLPQTKK